MNGPSSEDGDAAERRLHMLDLGPDAGSAQLILPGALDASDVEAIRAIVVHYVQVMRGAAEGFDLALPQLEIWMVDLPEALTALAPRVVSPPVVPTDLERLGGGQVAGKTMPLKDYWSRAAKASPGIGLVSDDGFVKAVALFNFVREIGHTLVERLGTLSGIREIGWHPSVHVRRKAKNAVRHGLDEWRVSTMATSPSCGELGGPPAAAGQGGSSPDRSRPGVQHGGVMHVPCRIRTARPGTHR